MAKEPELRSTGEDRDSLFSVEDELNVFRKRLDGPPDRRVAIPGFLFKDGIAQKFYPGELGTANLAFLNQHIETYKRALEAREQILDRIKPVEVLEVVRDVWGGRGEIAQTEKGANLVYSYFLATEEELTGTESHQRYDPINGNPIITRNYSYKTGKWIAYHHSVSMSIMVEFGNRAFPHKDALPEDPETFIKTWSTSPVSPPTIVSFPQGIWETSNNLGVIVALPFEPLSDLELNAAKTNHREFLPDPACGYLPRRFTWYDQSVSQEEIKRYLSQWLEAQKRSGYLPSQREAVETAKILELHKRGLLKNKIIST